MSFYDYDKFMHLVPEGHTIPKGTPMRSVMSGVETFFTAKYDFPVYDSNPVKYYLTYDITAPKLPEETNSVIYNANVSGTVYPVAVYQGASTWSAFSVIGNRRIIYTSDIESFDLTPPKEEAGDER